MGDALVFFLERVGGGLSGRMDRRSSQFVLGRKKKPTQRCLCFSQPSISALIKGSCGGVVAES